LTILLTEKTKVVQASDPVAVTATANSADIGLRQAPNYHQTALLAIVAGLWTDGTHTFKVQEADDDGAGAPDTWGDVAAADLQGTAPVIDGLDDDNTVHLVEYIGEKEWVRVVNTVTDSPATGLVYGVVAILGDPTTLPTV
jgi:hypothetical protein